MKKKTIFYLIACTVMLWLQSCKHNTSSDNNMAFDSVNFVEKFPRSITLQNKTEPKIDVIGIRNFAIYDSLLIFSTINDDALWSLVSLNNYSTLGNFLKKGQGPFEFIESPSVGSRATFSKQDSLFAYIYDSQKGNLLKMNIDESLRSKETKIYSVSQSLPSFLFNLVLIDSVTFMGKEINPTQTQQIRYLIHGKDKKPIQMLSKLNNAKIEQGEDINILSTITKRNEKQNILVEMPIGLNHLNLYTLDGKLRKSICIGKQLDNIDDIQEKKRQNRLYTFADLRIFEKYFGVLQINEEEETYQTARRKKPSILLFDWVGNPLAELKLDHHITSFDIDFQKGDLYTFDAHSDEFYKYNIKDFLTDI